jgi:uncharacterized protein (TIGR02391 family)
MTQVHEIVRDAESLLALEPEEVALILLQSLVSSGLSLGPKYALKRGNMFMHGTSPANGYPAEYRERLDETFAAAWVWLEREGMLLPASNYQDPDWVFVSNRGRQLTSRENFDAYRYSQLLPHKVLHPLIAASTFALFMRGHYDTVVFEVFRAVEVAVRTAAGLSQNLIGVALMRSAFATPDGPVTDTSLVAAEREAMSNLFAGAIGLFKNPTSHRLAAIERPQDAVDLVMLGNYLLRLVDQRSPTVGRS